MVGYPPWGVIGMQRYGAWSLVLVWLAMGCNDGGVTAGQNEPPVAEAGDNLTVMVHEQVNFDGSASYDPDGTIINYEWDFGNGDTDVGQQANYAWDTPGEYTVTLTVTDNDGDTGTDSPTITIDVEPYPGVYAVQANPNQQDCGGLATVTFASTNVDMIINDPNASADWHWELITHPTGEPLAALEDPPGVEGNISGDTFVMTWRENQLDTSGQLAGYSNDTWTGTFNGDGTMDTTLITDVFGPDIFNPGSFLLYCNISWNVSGTKVSELP